MRVLVPLSVTTAVGTPWSVRAGYLPVSFFELFIQLSVLILPGRSGKFAQHLPHEEKASYESPNYRKIT